MSELKKLASRLMTLDDKLIFCMKCGNCQAVCPMFGATHMEADVARGKLALIGNLAHEVIRDPEAVADKLGRCLLCGSCQANCPSGVRIMDIFMEARELVYAYLGLNPVKKMIFASSPPSSITASVPGSRALTAAAVAYTSCTKSRLLALATPSPAEPVITACTCSPAYFSSMRCRISQVFSRTLEKCRS